MRKFSQKFKTRAGMASPVAPAIMDFKTSRRDCMTPRRETPGSLLKFFALENRGRRERRVLAAPAVSRAKRQIVSAHEHTGTVGAFRRSPRNGFTAYAALSPATNSSCHRHRRIEDFAAPGWARKNLHRLDTSNGCQDHTVLPYAARLHKRFRRAWYPSAEALAKADLAPFVWRAMIAHGRPALRSRSRPTPLRPPHPIPTFVTTADAPRAE